MSSQQSCTIGVDMGTTNVKVIALDPSGREIARATEHVPLEHAATGAAEQDPRVVYEMVTSTLVRVAQTAYQFGYTVRCVGVSAALHSMIPVAADGTPLMPAIIWMDTRARNEAEALAATSMGKELYVRTGTPIHPMTPLAKLLWLRASQPHVLHAAYKFVSLKEWLWYQWFGEWVADESLASATGLYNLRERAWDAGAMALAGIAREQLSPIVPATYSQRDIRDGRLRVAGITPDTVFVVGGGDGQFANLGVGAIDESALVLTIGTSLAVRAGTHAPITDAATQMFCYVLAEDHYIVGGPSNSGGIVLEWLCGTLLGNRPATPNDGGLAALIQAAGAARTDALLCLPYITGERAPLWRAEAKGVFWGLTLEDDAPRLMRAAIEGIVFNARWIASGVFARLGVPARIVATGKVLEQPWVRQLVADVFGLPVEFPGAVDASALGAVAIANIATGQERWEDVSRRRQYEAQQTWLAQPSPEQERYQRKFARFQRLATEVTTHLASLYLET